MTFGPMIVLIAAMKWGRAAKVTEPTTNNAILPVRRELAAAELRVTTSRYPILERSH
jgi:hypothetical protein